MTRIALIHATPVSIAPVTQAFAEHWPEAETPSILDDSLSVDQARSGTLTETMRQRFQALADYALLGGAEGILFTCSAFGEAIERVQERLSIPVLKPNQAMFESAVERGGHCVLLLTFAPSVVSMTREFEQMRFSNAMTFETILVDEAMECLSCGDAERHNRLIAEVAKDVEKADTILLGQFSMAQARDAVANVTDAAVLTAPESAVLAMRQRLSERKGS